MHVICCNSGILTSRYLDDGWKKNVWYYNNGIYSRLCWIFAEKYAGLIKHIWNTQSTVIITLWEQLNRYTEQGDLFIKVQNA